MKKVSNEGKKRQMEWKKKKRNIKYMYEFMYEYPKRTQANDVTYKRSERKRCLRVIRKIYLLNFLAAANRNISVVNLNFSVLPIMDR